MHDFGQVMHNLRIPFSVFFSLCTHMLMSTITNNKGASLEGAYGRSLLEYHKSMPSCTFNISLCARRGKGGHYQVWHEKYLHRLVLLFERLDV